MEFAIEFDEELGNGANISYPLFLKYLVTWCQKKGFSVFLLKSSCYEGQENKKTEKKCYFAKITIL